MRTPVEPDDQRTRVLAHRSGLLRAIEEIRPGGVHGAAELTNLAEVAGAGGQDVDLGTDTFERERDMGLLQDFREQLEEVDAALQRLDEGTYGVCVGCGGQIEAQRLQALPAAARCLRCQERSEATLVRDVHVAHTPVRAQLA